MPRSFDFSIPPFDRLDEAERRCVENALDIAYYPRDAVVVPRGGHPESLYVLIKGVVHERDNDDELVAVYTTGDAFDAMTLLKGKSRHQFIAHEEVITYLLPQDLFKQLTANNAAFEAFYFQSLLEKLEAQSQRDETQRMAAIMVARVDQAYLRPIVSVDPLLSIREAARVMKVQRANVLLVGNDTSAGLLSATDLRDVIIDGLDSASAVSTIATPELITIEADDFLVNAQLSMTRNRIRHLVVCDRGKLVGVLELADLLSFLSDHSHVVMVELDRADSIADLHTACERFLPLVQALHGSGMKIPFVAALVTELNRKLYRKLYELLAPPELLGNSCLLVMGSEGRGEQILRTDQDNALIVRNDTVDAATVQAVCEQFTRTLLDFGYPPCPGGMMVNNPEWVKPIETWKHDLYQWMRGPDAESFIRLAALLDATAVAGDDSLLARLKTYLYRQVQDDDAFHARFARAAVEFETPLGLFHQLLTSKDDSGEQLDIKKGGIFPIIHGVRALALQKKILAVNTFERINQLVACKVLDEPFADDVSEALQFMLQLRLKAVLEKLAAGQPADSRIDVTRLHKLERDSLKDALLIVKQFKAVLTHHFRLAVF